MFKDIIIGILGIALGVLIADLFEEFYHRYNHHRFFKSTRNKGDY